MNYVINNDGTVSAVVGGQSYTFGKDHPSYDKLIGCLQRRNTEHFEASYDIVSRINGYCEGYVNADGGELSWDGIPMPDLFTDRIMSMIQEGFPFKPMLNFLDNLAQNPSDNSILELFDFMDHKHMPITGDGCFLAYKAVSNDFKDLYTHSLDNSVGSCVEVPREKVDSNRDRGCSSGLHVGAIDYAKSYGGIDTDTDEDGGGGGNRLVICKVNPQDVVSVPRCSRYQKLRCSKYEVVAIFDNVFDKSVQLTMNEVYDIQEEEYNEEWKEVVAQRLQRLVSLMKGQREKELVG